MKKALRMLGLTAALTASVGLGTGAANAASAVAFVGTAHINCFGCGDSSGTASICVKGVTVTTPPIPPAVTVHDPSVGICGLLGTNTTATYTVHEDTGAGCVVSGTASGTTSGELNVAFNWTRVGAIAVISTTGDVNGAGVAAFVVTSPLGNPCGGAVTAEVVGAVAGT
jgi:hypothetical protein